jgi:hypothetical protein
VIVRALLVMALGACTYETRFEDCSVRCADDLTCPDGLACGNEGFCRAPNQASCCATNVEDFSGILQGDFRAAFDFVTTSTNLALLNQRAVCDGSQMFWTIKMDTNGRLTAETGGTSYTIITSAHSFNDGALHQIAVERKNAVFSITVDGKVDGAPGTSSASFTTLPPLQIGTESACGVWVPVKVTNVCLATP